MNNVVEEKRIEMKCYERMNTGDWIDFFKFVQIKNIKNNEDKILQILHKFVLFLLDKSINPRLCWAVLYHYSRGSTTIKKWYSEIVRGNNSNLQNIINDLYYFNKQLGSTTVASLKAGYESYQHTKTLPKSVISQVENYIDTNKRAK